MTIQAKEVEWLSPTQFLGRHQGKFGRNKLYDWLAEGKLPHIRIDRKILIPSDAFERMLDTQAQDKS